MVHESYSIHSHPVDSLSIQTEVGHVRETIARLHAAQDRLQRHDVSGLIADGDDDQRVEEAVACNMLNRMTEL